jgi:dTDP-glucose 4,6-dehydratase
VNFAAETHVDRSLYAAGEFIQTDVYGAFVLLEEARKLEDLKLFVQISTDEVYGSVETGSSAETDALMPRNPYSASKAGADRLAYSYWATYQVPVIVTRASNNYGPYQFPEKIIPLFVTHAIDDIPVPLYGDGMNVRDWLHVDDHCRAVAMLLDAGVPGETYNVGGGNEVPNVELTKRLIKPVADRQGHDRRYSVDCRKLRAMGWAPEVPFEQGLQATVEWYRANPSWWRPLKEANPAFRDHYQRHYKS